MEAEKTSAKSLTKKSKVCVTKEDHQGEVGGGEDEC